MHVKVRQSVKQAYILGSSDKTKDVALNLRHDVRKAFQCPELLKLPPTACYLEGVNPSIPDELMKFLYFLIAGKQKQEVISKVNLLTQSTGLNHSPSYTVKNWTCAEGEISSHTACTKDMLWFLL